MKVFFLRDCAHRKGQHKSKDDGSKEDIETKVLLERERHLVELTEQHGVWKQKMRKHIQKTKVFLFDNFDKCNLVKLF